MPDEGIGMGVVSIEAQREADAASDAEMDAALDKIIGPEDDPVPAQDSAPAPKEGRARDDTGKFAKKSAEPESDEPPEAPTDDATPEYNKALKSLKRDKVPQKVLDSLTPAEVVSWGKERAESQLHTDRIQSKNVELERAREILGQTATKAADPKDQPDVLGEALSEFSDYFGEDAAGPLKAFGEAILAKAGAGNKSQQDQLAKIVARMETQERNEAREALSERYDLSDARWSQTVEQAKMDANSYETIEAGMRAACKMLFAEDIQDNLNSDLHAEHGKRSKGQPTTEHRGQTPTEAKGTDDLEDELLDHILDGDDAEAMKTGRAIGNLAKRSRTPVVGRVGMK